MWIRWLLLAILVVVTIAGQREEERSDGDCVQRTACEPWELGSGGSGKACARGGRIPLEFKLDLASEDAELTNPVCGANVNHNVTFAFCPKVDELQAFNLSHSAQLSATYVNSTRGGVRLPSDTEGSWLRVRGLGTVTSRHDPQRGQSEGAILVAGPCPSDNSKTAVVPFVILNISMELGRFKYYEEWPQPAGVGFFPTCGWSKFQERYKCKLDGKMECIGDHRRKNCAVCYDAQTEEDALEMSKVHTRVWTSWYGTDKNGRQLRSGRENPLVFKTGLKFGSAKGFYRHS